jgi:hypothetical protein
MAAPKMTKHERALSEHAANCDAEQEALREAFRMREALRAGIETRPERLERLRRLKNLQRSYD